MLKLLQNVVPFLKLEKVTVSSFIFRLHCMYTTALLAAFSLFLTSVEFMGHRIECTGSLADRKKRGVEKYFQSYCWASSTFTMPDAFQRQVGVEVAHPGVANDFGDEDAKKYYAYYQWVCFVLFLQAMMCYAPKFIWDACEGGLVNTLCGDLGQGLLKPEDRKKKEKELIRYLQHVKIHKWYAIRYYALEALCLANIILQMHLMDVFLDGEFMSYGLRILTLPDKTQEDRVDPLVYVFPRVTKCVFHQYGASGDIENRDVMCVLPLNILNEKAYIFIWFWFMILAGLLTALVLYRLLLLAMPWLRHDLFGRRHRLAGAGQSLFRERDVGDWWLLSAVGVNIDRMIFRDVLSELSKGGSTGPA